MTKFRTMIGSLAERLRAFDWSLLIFLLLFLNVKFYVKILAILFAVLVHRKTNIPRQMLNNKWLSFYIAMPVLATVNILTSLSSLSEKNALAFALGFAYWLLAFAAAWYVYLFVYRAADREKSHRTVSIFFQLNLIIVLAGFLYICVDAGTINPYTFRGLHQKYFINTGDFLGGVTLDSSVTTALMNGFGVFYFLYRGKTIWSLFALLAVLLAGSNWVDLLLILSFIFIFFFRTSGAQKAIIGVHLLMIMIFMFKVSPQNKDYAWQILARFSGGFAYKIPPQSAHPGMIDLIEKKEVVEQRNSLNIFFNSVYSQKFRDSLKNAYHGWNYSGRWISWKQLGNFYLAHPWRSLIGTGMGNFSSRIAFKTAAIGVEGGYPADQRYISPFFRDNHLYTYLYYQVDDQGQHSVVNKPNSVYAQLLGEYGLAGIACFLLLYLSFFLQGIRLRTYGLPLLLVMCAAFLTEYWFEELSVVVLFELLMLLDTDPPPAPKAQNEES